MTDLLTAAATLAPFMFVFAVAAHTPRDSQGHRVSRFRRSFTSDVRSFLGGPAY